MTPYRGRPWAMGALGIFRRQGYRGRALAKVSPIRLCRAGSVLFGSFIGRLPRGLGEIIKAIEREEGDDHSDQEPVRAH